MSNDIGLRNYRKLLYFYVNEVWVHFTDKDGIFYNGQILDLNEQKLTLVIKERIKGPWPMLLEDIDEDSIKPFTLKEEREDGNKKI